MLSNDPLRCCGVCWACLGKTRQRVLDRGVPWWCVIGSTRPLNLKMGSRDPSPHLPSDPFASSGPSHAGVTAATGISKEERVPPPTMHAGAATNTATVSPNVQGEQETRTALLDSLIASFGQSILEGVDVEAIVQQRPPRSSIEPKKSVTYVSTSCSTMLCKLEI